MLGVPICGARHGPARVGWDRVGAACLPARPGARHAGASHVFLGEVLVVHVICNVCKERDQGADVDVASFGNEKVPEAPSR